MTSVPRARTFLAIGSASVVVTLGALALTTSATEGCYTHACDATSASIGLGPDGGIVGTGEVVARDSNFVWWESVPLVPPDGGTWTPHFPMESVTFYFPPASIPPNATVYSYAPYEAAETDAQVNNVNGAGNIDEFSDITTTSITVLNDTCALYYLRVVVTFQLPDAGPAQATDASPD